MIMPKQNKKNTSLWLGVGTIGFVLDRTKIIDIINRQENVHD